METCSICLDDDVEELVQLDCSCDVKYCLDCISQWFVNNLYDTCPICKEVVDLRGESNTTEHYQVKRVYNSYLYKVLNHDYIVSLNKYTTFNISCLDEIIYIKTGKIELEIINDMVANFITKIRDDVVKRPQIVDCEIVDNNLRCVYCSNDTSIFYQGKCLVIRLSYIEFNSLNKKYYPFFEIIGFVS